MDRGLMFLNGQHQDDEVSVAVSNPALEAPTQAAAASSLEEI